MPGKSHFAAACKQAAVAAVVIRQNLSLRAQFVDGLGQVDQVFRVVQIWNGTAFQIETLRQDGASRAHLPLAQIDQNQRCVSLGAVELRRERTAHIGERGEGADDQRHRRGHFLAVSAIGPDRAHRERILADGNGHAQRRTQLHTDRLDGLVQSRVLPGLAASGHPVGRQFDAGQLDGCSQQIGNGFGDGHAARRRRINHGQRGTLAQAHRFAGKAPEIGQRHGAISHRHLPRADHLVAVRQATHRAVADGDQETLGGHGRVTQHGDAAFLQVHTCQVDRLDDACDALHVALHFGRFAQQYVHGHIYRGPHVRHWRVLTAPRGGCACLGRPGAVYVAPTFAHCV